MNVIGCNVARQPMIEGTKDGTHISESRLEIERAPSEGRRSQRRDDGRESRCVCRFVGLDILDGLDDDTSLRVGEASGGHLLESKRLESSDCIA